MLFFRSLQEGESFSFVGESRLNKKNEQFIKEELDKLEAELEEKEEKAETPSGIVSKEEIVYALQISKDAVEEVFGPIFSLEEKTKKEQCRMPIMNVFLAVLGHICPRQVNYNVVESFGNEEEF